MVGWLLAAAAAAAAVLGRCCSLAYSTQTDGQIPIRIKKHARRDRYRQWARGETGTVYSVPHTFAGHQTSSMQCIDTLLLSTFLPIHSGSTDSDSTFLAISSKHVGRSIDRSTYWSIDDHSHLVSHSVVLIRSIPNFNRCFFFFIFKKSVFDDWFPFGFCGQVFSLFILEILIFVCSSFSFFLVWRQRKISWLVFFLFFFDDWEHIQQLLNTLASQEKNKFSTLLSLELVDLFGRQLFFFTRK